MAYYKQPFKHRLEIHESRVFEVLSAMISLSFEYHHQPLLPLDGLKDIQTHVEAIQDIQWEMTFLFQHQDFLFSWMEFALITEERSDIQSYFDAIETLNLTDKWFYFLGSRIAPETLNSCAHSPEAFYRVLLEHEVKDAAQIYEFLFKFDDLLHRFRQLATNIDTCPAFSETLENQRKAGIYQQTQQLFSENMTDRHPLSYAQELMSKPFWNIADYEEYEFVIIYYLSPYRLRLSSAHRMIYVHSLIRLNSHKEDVHLSLAEQHKLLSDANRLKILQMLYMKPMYGKQIADATGLTTATVSHHLEVLKQHGLIHMEQEKQIKYFSTNLSRLKSLNQETLQYIQSAPASSAPASSAMASHTQ